VFLYESALRSFSLATFWLWQTGFGFGKRILAKKAFSYKKRKRKMMNLTTAFCFFY